MVRALLCSPKALLLACQLPWTFRRWSKREAWCAGETGMEEEVPAPAGEIMGAMKPVQILQAGFPSTSITPGHSVETLTGFTPLSEVHE